MKEVPKDLEELVIDNKGNLTLRGRPVDAIPIGRPIHVSLNSVIYGPWSPYNTYKKIREGFRKEYLLPDETNAVIFGHDSHLIGPDLRIFAVQPYKIRRKK